MRINKTSPLCMCAHLWVCASILNQCYALDVQWVSWSYLFDDPFLQQTVFLSSHDKVMRVIFVVDYVLQINA